MPDGEIHDLVSDEEGEQLAESPAGLSPSGIQVQDEKQVRFTPALALLAYA